MLRQRRLDLAQLDTEAAQLHLMVTAAEVLDVARRQPARHVPAPVERVALLGDERIGDEALRRQLGAIQVPARHLHAADEELPANADRHRRAQLVEQVDPRVLDRLADRHDRRTRHARPRGDVDRGLGRAVEVVKLDVREARREAVHHRRQERLAAREDALQGGAVRPRRVRLQLVEEDLEHRRDEVQRGDTLLVEEAHEVRGILVAFGPGDDERGPEHQRPEELPHRHVEAERRLLEDAIGGGEPVRVLHPLEAIEDPRCSFIAPWDDPSSPRCRSRRPGW